MKRSTMCVPQRIRSPQAAIWSVAKSAGGARHWSRNENPLEQEERQLKMKNKLIFIMVLFVAITPALSARDSADDKSAQRTVTQLSVSDVENSPLSAQQASPAAPSEPKLTPKDYEAAMLSVTQRFSATLAVIAEAVQQGKLHSEQAEEMSAEQYQLAQMQFQLLSLWRAIEEEDVARSSDSQANPALTQDGEIVMVALPFSSLQLNPSLSEYLSLTPSQVAAIQQVMVRQRQSLQPLMTQMRITREKLLAAGTDHMNEKEVKNLAQAEAALLARLIVANARMQSKIYKVLSPDQQRKLSDLERTQGSSAAKESE
jgi:Spy/CpxP family protein refolding chaperone